MQHRPTRPDAIAFFLALALLLLTLVPSARAAEVRVASDAALREALAAASAGTTILIAPGTYRGSLARSNLHGTADEPVLIAGADPANPPELVGEAASHGWPDRGPRCACLMILTTCRQHGEPPPDGRNAQPRSLPKSGPGAGRPLRKCH